MNRCGNSGRDREEGQFAYTSRAPRTIWIRHFDEDRFHFFRNIPNSRDEIRAELVGEHASVFGLVIFQYCIALCLYNRAFHLSFYERGVDWLAHIISRDHV